MNGKLLGVLLHLYELSCGFSPHRQPILVKSSRPLCSVCLLTSLTLRLVDFIYFTIHHFLCALSAQ